MFENVHSTCEKREIIAKPYQRVIAAQHRTDNDARIMTMKLYARNRTPPPQGNGNKCDVLIKFEFRDCCLNEISTTGYAMVTIQNTKELMHCQCGTNNRALRWTFTTPAN